jgi:hypothetical protein
MPPVFEQGGKVPIVVGDGEYHATPSMYPLLNTLARAANLTGLDELFAKYNQPHWATHARGGFVADPGQDFSYGQEPQIAAHLDRLGKGTGHTIYGISGHRTPAHSVAVGGFADDPHTRGEAADIGVDSQLRSSAGQLSEATYRRYGLYRPFYPPDPNEINHVQLLAGAKHLQALVGTAGSPG